MQVTITDSRPAWVQKEDKLYSCQTFCNLYPICSSRMGHSCKHLGGKEVPKIRTSKRKGVRR